jgi:hypothetical protein
MQRKLFLLQRGDKKMEKYLAQFQVSEIESPRPSSAKESASNECSDGCGDGCGGSGDCIDGCNDGC